MAVDNLAQMPLTYMELVLIIFFDVINDAFLEQFVTTPTCQNNILDLVFSTHQRISDLSTVPGMSDHDASTFHLDISQKSSHIGSQCKVVLYHKGDIAQIKRELLAFKQTFLSSDPQSKPVDRNWQKLKQAINNAVLNHISHRTVRSHNCLPWINKKIKKYENT